jgi:NAD(P)H-hydrate epimerase
MKVVSAKAMAALENRAYQQGCSEKDFMENAGKGIAFNVQSHFDCCHVWLLCGKGNNGGDAFVAGRYLLEQGFTVTAIQPEPLTVCSPLCQLNASLFQKRGGRICSSVDTFSPGVIVDGFFGTGFKGSIREPYAALVERANASGLPIIAVDIPSGVNGSTGEVEGTAINATTTLFLELPKTGFFLQQGWNQVGQIRAVPFGLPSAIKEDAQGDFELITQQLVHDFLPPIKRNRHKYAAGYVAGLAGSATMPGAALLASEAALRGGSGMVRLFHSQGMEVALACSPYELIKIPYDDNNLDPLVKLLNQAGALFIGPGLGRDDVVRKRLKTVVPLIERPCVIDADALIAFAQEPFKLPPQTIFTPHSGEMQTLLKKEERLTLNLELLATCQKYVEEHQITLIYKGAPTFVFHPGKQPFLNPTGDPGMATAGSGDVLTGLLASLLSQKCSCHEAALLGVYLHGLAGEIAAHKRGVSYGIVASDLIANFSDAYLDILT